jgi:hypothetical protein
MPFVWKASIVLLLVCLMAAMAIGIVRLVETPNEILGDGFRDLPAKQVPQPKQR